MAEQVLTAPAERHHDLFEQLVAEVAVYNPEVDRDLLERAYAYGAEAHEGQQRRSGDDFILHPLGVARILAELGLDDASIAGALMHDVVEDTDASLEAVRAELGEDVARLVEGVTKLTRIQFQSREQAQAENYRKMVMAMAEDYRVILIKLADRLHNMRTIEYLGKQKQLQKARETLEVYAPLAHRLGIHSIKWELEDLAFQTLHPRKYVEIQSMVNERRADREKYVDKAGKVLQRELEKVGISAEIAARAKHFYSIYEKMAKRGKEFNEIYDLTAMRVLVEQTGKEGERDCYGALGIIHSLWKPMPGRFKDYVAMPKFNMYRSLHTTVIGPEGKPLEIQVRTREMHRTAEQGIAAHWLYKGKKGKKAEADQLAWMKQLADWQREEADPQEFKRAFPELASDEVYVFTPKGEVKNLPGGSTPIDFAYAVHTDVGHRTVGAKVNGKIVPLHYALKSGDIVEILTAKRERGPSRDWLALVKTTRARNKIRAWFKAESRGDSEHTGRDLLQEHLKKAGLPAQKITGSALLADVIREMGFRKADDFYIALGGAKISAKTVVNKVMQRLKQGESAEAETSVAEDLLKPTVRRKPEAPSSQFGIRVEGVEDVPLRLAKCCRPVSGDPILGYVSLGRGITIHREDCPNAEALRKDPERFVAVSWDGDNETSFKVEIQVDAWDRHRLLEDLSRTFAEGGINIVEAYCSVQHPMVKNRFVIEVGDTQALKTAINRLRAIDSVFDAYRVIPSGGG